MGIIKIRKDNSKGGLNPEKTWDFTEKQRGFFSVATQKRNSLLFEKFWKSGQWRLYRDLKGARGH